MGSVAGGPGQEFGREVSAISCVYLPTFQGLRLTLPSNLLTWFTTMSMTRAGEGPQVESLLGLLEAYMISG